MGLTKKKWLVQPLLHTGERSLRMSKFTIGSRRAMLVASLGTLKRDTKIQSSQSWLHLLRPKNRSRWTELAGERMLTRQLQRDRNTLARLVMSQTKGQSSHNSKEIYLCS